MPTLRGRVVNLLLALLAHVLILIGRLREMIEAFASYFTTPTMEV